MTNSILLGGGPQEPVNPVFEAVLDALPDEVVHGIKLADACETAPLSYVAKVRICSLKMIFLCFHFLFHLIGLYHWVVRQRGLEIWNSVPGPLPRKLWKSGSWVSISPWKWLHTTCHSMIYGSQLVQWPQVISRTGDSPRGGGTHICAVYGDVPLKRVTFLQRSPKHG